MPVGTVVIRLNELERFKVTASGPIPRVGTLGC